MQTEKKTTGPGSASATSGRPGIVDTARDTARREMDDARQRLSGAAHRAKTEARQARSSVSRIVMDEMDKRKDELCTSLHGLAESMRKGAEEAERREDSPNPPRLVHQAIDTLDDLANRMRHRSTEDLTGAVARFGRENPALFVAGAMFAGLALGRFLVSSSSPRHDRDRWDGEGAAARPGYYGGTGATGSRYGSARSGSGYQNPDYGPRSGAQDWRNRDDLQSGAGRSASGGTPSGQSAMGGTGSSARGPGAFAGETGSSLSGAGASPLAGAMNEGVARGLEQSGSSSSQSEKFQSDKSPSGTSQSGTSQSGTSQSGSSQFGTSQGGTSQAGSSDSPDFDKMKRGVGATSTTEDKDGSA